MTVGMSFLSPTPCATAKGDGRCSTGAATAMAKGLSEVTGTVPKLGVSACHIQRWLVGITYLQI